MRIGSSLWVVFTCLVWMGCQEENASVEFRFTEPKSGQEVWNTTPVTVAMPSGFSGTLEVSVDGVVIGQATATPFHLDWNTRTLPDGDYTLVARATSVSGEQTETRTPVHIKNTLLTLQVPDQHVPSGMQAFLYLSDATGKTIAVQELINGEPIRIEGTEDFNLPTFTVNEVYIRYPGLLQAFSITEVGRGPWTLNQTRSPEFVGSIQVKSETVPEGVYFVSASGDYDFIDPVNQTIQLATTESSGKLFVRDVGTEDNRYALINDVNVGSLWNLPANAVNTPLKKISIPLSDPDLISARVSLFGFSQSDKYEEHYPLGVFFRAGPQIKIDYPEEFLYLGSESYYRNKQVRMYSFDPKKLYDFKMLNAQIYVSTKDERIVDIATFGDFDIYMLSWYYYNEPTNSSASWVLIGPSGRSQKIALPQVPVEITQRVPNIRTNELEFTGVTQVSEYGVTKGYADYLNYISIHGIAGPYQFGLSWKEQLFTESGITAGRDSRKEPRMLSELLNRVIE